MTTAASSSRTTISPVRRSTTGGATYERVRLSRPGGGRACRRSRASGRRAIRAVVVELPDETAGERYVSAIGATVADVDPEHPADGLIATVVCERATAGFGEARYSYPVPRLQPVPDGWGPPAGSPRTAGRSGFTLRQHVVLGRLEVEKTITYRDLVDELVEMPRIREPLDLDSVPAPSTRCKAFDRLEVAVWRVSSNVPLSDVPVTGVTGIDASGFERARVSTHYTNRGGGPEAFTEPVRADLGSTADPIVYRLPHEKTTRIALVYPTDSGRDPPN